MENEGALLLWDQALSADFPMDKDTFLISSLLPLAYDHYCEKSGTTYLVVDVEQVRKFVKEVTFKMVTQQLISRGYIRWLGDKKDQIVVGGISGMRHTFYFMGDNTTAAKKKQPEATMATDAEMIPVLDNLEKIFEKYSSYCSAIQLNGVPEQVFKKINTSIKGAYASSFTPTGLLNYLTATRAMVEDWMTLPAGSYTVKEIQLAKGLIQKYDSKKLIALIPYFVEHYPAIARKGYQEAGIVNLHYNISTMLMHYSKSHKNRVANDTDTL